VPAASSLAALYQPGRFGLSFEIFPPKTPEGDEALWQAVRSLAAYRPGFISCTYGAGGSTRQRTLEMCEQITRRFGVDATAHFTCLGGTITELEEWLSWARQHGVKNIMALRGDPPAGQTGFQQTPGGLSYANEVVALIRRVQPGFGIGVAGYPEKHPQAPSLAVDIDNLKRKVDAGADAIFPEAMADEREFAAVRAAISVPLLANMTEFGKSRLLSAQQLTDLGYNMVIYPVTTQRLAMKAVEDGLRTILETGTQESLIDKMQTRQRLYEVLNYESYNQYDAAIYNFSLKG